MNLTDEIKKALKAKGYKLPEFKDSNERAKFVAKHGYDPGIVINQTIRMIDATGMAEGWEERIPTL
jgi:hypothetical protein